jgi:hypothetical protein
MSHFSVLVITDEEPVDGVLEKALQPYHEYECTGIEDEYVVNVDKHDEALALYAKETRSRWKDTAGNLHDPYDDRFYRELTPEEIKAHGPMPFGTGCGNGISWHSRDWGDGKGYRAKAKMKAADAGMEEVSIPASKVETIDQWAKDWGGWERGPDGRFFDRTNPNRKWDWWSVGGRYNGRLMLVPGAAGGKGRGGLMTPLADTGFDYCRRDQLDFAAMKRARETERREWLDECLAKTDLKPDEVDAAFWAVAELHEAWRVLPEPRPRGLARRALKRPGAS